MHTYPEIWSCTEDRERLWQTDPARAARLAYLEVLAAWYEQVEGGSYRGVPAVHKLPARAEAAASVSPEPQNVVRLRPPQYTPDASAREYCVPVEIRRRFETAA